MSVTYRAVGIVLVMTAVSCVVGCGARSLPPAVASDPTAARAALVDVLDAWKSGADAKSLAAKDPQTFANDEDWSTGDQLREYKVVGEPEPFGNNVRFEVELVLGAKSGATVRKSVRYTVATDPVRNVMRDDS